MGHPYLKMLELDSAQFLIDKGWGNGQLFDIFDLPSATGIGASTAAVTHNIYDRS
jgi:galactokinase/mevalonate kinase-like predicted kinase